MFVPILAHSARNLLSNIILKESMMLINFTLKHYKGGMLNLISETQFCNIGSYHCNSDNISLLSASFGSSHCTCLFFLSSFWSFCGCAHCYPENRTRLSFMHVHTPCLLVNNFPFIKPLHKYFIAFLCLCQKINFGHKNKGVALKILWNKFYLCFFLNGQDISQFSYT